MSTFEEGETPMQSSLLFGPFIALVLFSPCLADTQNIDLTCAARVGWAYPKFNECKARLARSQPVAQSFEVSATRGWQVSPIIVSQGQQVSITASGSWTVDYRNFSYVGPDGYSPAEDSRIYQGCKLVLVQVPYGRLLAKIGNTGYVIGQSGKFIANDTGPLAFRIHDANRCLADNAGSVGVTVATVQPTPAIGKPDETPPLLIALPSNAQMHLSFSQSIPLT
jgi:hypothetical protein